MDTGTPSAILNAYEQAADIFIPCRGRYRSFVLVFKFVAKRVLARCGFFQRACHAERTAGDGLVCSFFGCGGAY